MSDDQVSPDIGAAVEGLVGSILEPKPAEEPKTEVREVETEAPAPEPAKDEEPKAKEEPQPPKEKIKWQGQEVELSLDEMKNLAQQGYDYTKKMQELQARVAPLEGLKKRIDEDPGFAAHIAGYFNRGQQPEAQAPKFEDPIDQLKWEIKQEAVREVEEKYLRPVREHQQQLTHQQRLQMVRSQVQADPQYAEVQQSIQSYVSSLPPALQRTTYLQLDQDPNSYMEAFQHFKSRLAKTEQPKAEPPKTVQKAERAPILESSGTTQPTSQSAEKRKQIERLKTKALRSGDPIAISEWLQAGGHIDNILR
jgi:hypothetical protein